MNGESHKSYDPSMSEDGSPWENVKIKQTPYENTQWSLEAKEKWTPNWKAG